MTPNDRAFRERLTQIQARSGLSMRALSAAMGRDTGYVAALLDPSRPSRARPTPADLMAASNATGISFVELLEALWGIDPERLARELRGLPEFGGADAPSRKLTAAERSLVADFAELLVARRSRLPPRS
jgi:transcriptional regulator with XRE-family HTH domain